jgi:hypothetical protein
MTTSKKVTLSADDLWLFRLFVLMRPGGPVSEEIVLALRVRTALRALVKSGHLGQVEIRASLFEATGLGKKAASATRVRLSSLLAISDDFLSR